jgi:hypothetical protein
MLQHLFEKPELQKAVLLLLPVFMWVAQTASRRYSTREYAGAFLAFVWQFQASLILNIIFLRLGFWKFAPTDALLLGVPVDVMLGQTILLGPVIFLILRKISIYWKIIFSCLLLYGLFNTSIVMLQSYAWCGVISIMLMSIVPSLLIAEWTTTETHLYLRTILQSLSWASVLLWLFPSMIFQATDSSWAALLDRSIWKNFFYLLPLCIPAFILLSALKQFAVEGLGTAFPYDPPKRLVTHGIYAYLSNPMQVGICLMVGWWGVVLANYLLIISSIVAAILFRVFKDICNGSCAIGDENPDWDRYQNEVPKWIPRRTPWKY